MAWCVLPIIILCAFIVLHWCAFTVLHDDDLYLLTVGFFHCDPSYFTGNLCQYNSLRLSCAADWQSWLNCCFDHTCGVSMGTEPLTVHITIAKRTTTSLPCLFLFAAIRCWSIPLGTTFLILSVNHVFPSNQRYPQSKWLQLCLLGANHAGISYVCWSLGLHGWTLYQTC